MALTTTLLAIAFALGMNWLFLKGWYFPFAIPTVAAAMLGAIASVTVQKAKCRSPLLAGSFGVFLSVILYGGFLYFGMLSHLGLRNAARFDLFPDYIRFRLRSEINRTSEGPGNSRPRPNPTENGIFHLVEIGIVIFLIPRLASRKARRAFCEKCGEWTQQDFVTFPPGNAKVIADWLENDELARIAGIPLYTPKGKSKRATIAAVERCVQSTGENCPVYFAVKDSSAAFGARQVVFDESYGRISVPRVELSSDERAALTPVFPQLSSKLPAAATSDKPDFRRATPLIEVQQIPQFEANLVLNKKSIFAGTLLTLSFLPVFWASIIGTFVGIHYGLKQFLPPDGKPNPLHPIQWLALAVVSLAVAIVSGYIGQKNSGVLGNRLYRYLSRQSLAQRRNKWVDPDRPSDLPTYFVQVVPRKNWGRPMWETAVDTGFFQIDARRRELRFEGDVERFRIPIAALTSCELENYSRSAGTTRLQYCVVVLRGKTASGLWEAPISLRQTKWFVPANHRQQTAAEILSQILPLMPLQPPPLPDPLAAIAGAYPILPLGTPIRPGSPAPVLRARSEIPRRLALWMLVSFVLVVLVIWLNNNAKRIRQTGSQGTAVSLPMALGDFGLTMPMRVTNVRIGQQFTDAPPYFTSGGDWTVLQCSPAADPQATITFAYQTPQTVDPNTILENDAAILPGDPAAGARFVTAMAKAFGATNPPAQPATAPRPLKMGAFVVGQNLSNPQAGFTPWSGTWVAMKWILPSQGLHSTIWLNYDAATGDAQFVQNDPTMTDPLLQTLAAEIRDGSLAADQTPTSQPQN
jgi:hypothetical protein